MYATDFVLQEIHRKLSDSTRKQYCTLNNSYHPACMMTNFTVTEKSVTLVTCRQGRHKHRVEIRATWGPNFRQESHMKRLDKADKYFRYTCPQPEGEPGHYTFMWVTNDENPIQISSKRTLKLGQENWPEIQDTYICIAEDPKTNRLTILSS